MHKKIFLSPAVSHHSRGLSGALTLRTIFSLSFIFVTTLSFAQFKGGFYAGFNGSQVDGDNYAGYYKLGLNLSAAVEYPLSDYFGASMEISYSQKGSQSKPMQGVPRAYFLKLDYVEVPFMLNYHDQKKMTLCAGASVNRLVHYFEDIGPWSGGVSRPTGIRDLNNFSYDFKAGGSYQLNNHFLFNVIYSYSISRMGTSEDSRFLNFGMYNNLVEFRIGYLIKGQASK